MLRPSFLPCLLLTLWALPCVAGEAYRWTDERGVVHFTEQAPPGTPARPVPLAPGSSPPAASPTPPVAPPRRPPVVVTPPPPQPTVVPAPRATGEDNSCAAQWRAFEASAACFAPFRTVNGMRPEAWSVCREVAQPDCARSE